MLDTDRPNASSPNGFALVELLTVLVLAGFFSSVLLQTTLCLQRCLGHWETSARMRQTLSAALFQMSRDFRVTGCNPIGDAASEETAILRTEEPLLRRCTSEWTSEAPRPGAPRTVTWKTRMSSLSTDGTTSIRFSGGTINPWQDESFRIPGEGPYSAC